MLEMPSRRPINEGKGQSIVEDLNTGREGQLGSLKGNRARLVRRFIRATTVAGLTLALFASLARASPTVTEVKFTIPGGQSQPFITQIVIKSQGRIVVDVNSIPRTVEVTVLLRRPDGTVASSISGKGGNLSLTYFVTSREVNDSLAAGNLRWSVEVSKVTSSDAVSGSLKTTHPGP